MKKLRSKRGFTLAEVLLSVLLLGFVTLMAAVMTSAVLDTTVTMQDVAQAEILGSDALENIQKELRLAQSVKLEEGGGLTFDYNDANKDFMFSLKEGKIALGRIKEGAFSGGEFFLGVSYGDLSVTELNFSKGTNEGTVQIELTISRGENSLWQGGVTVMPLNGVK